jgi:hypothetical protein
MPKNSDRLAASRIERMAMMTTMTTMTMTMTSVTARDRAAGLREQRCNATKCPQASAAFLAHPQLIVCHASDIHTIVMLHWFEGN